MRFLLLLLLVVACGKNNGRETTETPAIKASDVEINLTEKNLGKALKELNKGTTFNVPRRTENYKILVLGHIYDVFEAHLEDQFVEFVNTQDADLIVLAGDSIFGAQDDTSEATLDQQWKELDHLISRFNHQTIMVAGNHDGWSYKEHLQQLAFDKFKENNLINFEINVSVKSRKVGLFFAYTGDFSLPRSRIESFTSKIDRREDSIIFGGHLVNAPIIEALENATKNNHKKLTYISGDWQQDQNEIEGKNFHAYNIVSVCKNSFNALIIDIGEHETLINNVSNQCEF